MDAAKLLDRIIAISRNDTVQKLGVSFDTYQRDIKQSRMLRGYVEAWSEAVYAEYDRV